MPELPEVEMFRRYVEGSSLHRPVREVEIFDNKVVSDTEQELKNALKGRRLEGTDRVGKYLFLNFGEAQWLMMHFGMTGSPELYRQEEEPPRFTRVAFHFEDGFSLAYRCARKFGRLKLTHDVEAYCKAKKIGTDALKLPYDRFREMVGKRKAPIKAVLMDQKIAAGVGNWIADEVLYQAKLHPEKPANELSARTMKTLFDKVQFVIQTAVDNEAHFPDFPKDFMIHSRWTDDGRPDAPRIELEKIVVGGRSTYFDPKTQRL